jgi:alkylation response protein AidB-like acyl-CoA dehydrogenase
MDFELAKEQKDIKSAAKEFAESEFVDKAEELDANEAFDEAIFKKAAELGFVGTFIKEEYGGQGLGTLENCLIFEEFTAVDPGIAAGVLSTCFGAEILQTFGSEDQKARYLPPLASGQAILSTALTDANAGSDLAGAVLTTAHLDKNEYIINGSKMFISNGTRANQILTFVLTHPEEAHRHKRHSMIILDVPAKGLERRKLHGKLGVRAYDTAELFFSDVRVPDTNLIGRTGDGFAQAMHLFNTNRICVAAQAIGIARAALEESLRYVTKRQAFGAPLASFQAIQFKIADMFILVQAGRNLVYEAAWRVDAGNIDHKLIAAAKAFSGQTAVRCADMALQLHGGYGYLSEYKVQRLYRDAKITEIYEGTTEIEKIIIAKGLLGR